VNIVIVGDEIAFPRGFASSNYVRLLARSIVEAGAHAHVVALDYSERGTTPLNTEAKGILDGVTFEYTTGSTHLPRFAPAIPWGRARSHVRFFGDMVSRSRRGALDAMLYYGRYTDELLYVLAVARAAGVPLAVCIVEWRLSYTDQTRAQVINDKLFARALGGVDGALVISRFLVERVTPRLPVGAPCVRVPILAEPEAWRDVVPAQRATPYVVLCTDFDSYPDDALSVLRAAARVERSAFELLFIGKASATTQQRLRAEALPSHITLSLMNDYVSSEALRALYAGAAALVAPLPDTDRARARFPSKLADYLLAGRPVVSSRVGEVAAFLRDGESAWLAEPGDRDGLTRALTQALQSGRAVGDAGRRVALEHFDHARVGTRVVDFFKQLTRGRSR
jgi:glycosyltransferase involved in cell wall biosynthesis